MAVRAVVAAAALALSAFADADAFAKPVSATDEALRALDTDGSGKVERSEIEAFAQAQGLTLADVQNEFKDLDTNGDGDLSVSEIGDTLAQPELASAVPSGAA